MGPGDEARNSGRVADPGALLQGLVDTAEQQNELLCQEEWEAALELQPRFDGWFEDLQAAVVTQPFGREHTGLLRKLETLQGHNADMLEALKRQAGSALTELDNARKIMNYAPLGKDPERTARYLDESA